MPNIYNQYLCRLQIKTDDYMYQILLIRLGFFFSQEQVCELYQQLHASDHSELLQNFESIILGVLKDVRFYQVENERLEKSFKRWPWYILHSFHACLHTYLIQNIILLLKH